MVMRSFWLVTLRLLHPMILFDVSRDEKEIRPFSETDWCLTPNLLWTKLEAFRNWNRRRILVTLPMTFSLDGILIGVVVLRMSPLRRLSNHGLIVYRIRIQ